MAPLHSQEGGRASQPHKAVPEGLQSETRRQQLPLRSGSGAAPEGKTVELPSALPHTGCQPENNRNCPSIPAGRFSNR